MTSVGTKYRQCGQRRPMIVTAIYYPCLSRVICALTADHTLTLHTTALLCISHISYHILLEKMKVFVSKSKLYIIECSFRKGVTFTFNSC